MKSAVTSFRIKYASTMTGRVLDCGAGEGVYTQYLTNATSIMSVDIDEPALRALGTDYTVAPAENLPFEDNSFDSVWACALVEHIETDVIPELLRVCKVGGKIAVLTPNRRSPFDPIKKLFGFRTWDQHTGHIHLWTVKELAKYGPVYGEVRFLPLLAWFFKRIPSLAHTIMLYGTVTPEMKRLARNNAGESAPRDTAPGSHSD